TVPSDPNRRLGLLEQGTGGNWQWLPLVGPDFPLQSYAQRGPLVAWTPHLSGVALKLDRPPAEGPVHPSGGRRSFLIAALGLLLVLGGVNLWATLTLPRSIPPANTAPAPGPPVDVPATNRAKATENSGERFARALHHLLRTHEGTPEWGPAEITRQYDR